MARLFISHIRQDAAFALRQWLNRCQPPPRRNQGLTPLGIIRTIKGPLRNEQWGLGNRRRDGGVTCLRRLGAS